MSIVQRRSFKSVIKGVWTHSLSILTMFTFPYQLTVFLHKLRGVHVGKKTHIARGVILEYVDYFEPLKNGKRRYFMNDLSN